MARAWEASDRLRPTPLTNAEEGRRPSRRLVSRECPQLDKTDAIQPLQRCPFRRKKRGFAGNYGYHNPRVGGSSPSSGIGKGPAKQALSRLWDTTAYKRPVNGLSASHVATQTMEESPSRRGRWAGSQCRRRARPWLRARGGYRR